MNITELAGLVCQKIRQTDAVSLAAAASFIRQRHEMIWNEALWRESVNCVNVPYYAENEGVVLLPEGVNKVMACRASSGPISVIHDEDFFQVTEDAFEKIGEPVSFSIKPKCVIQAPEHIVTGINWSLGFRSTNESDRGKKVNIKYTHRSAYGNYADTAALELNICDGYYPNSSAYNSIPDVVSVESVSKDVTDGIIYADAITIYFWSDFGTPLFEIPAEATAAYRRCRVALTPKPDANMDLVFMVKSDAPDLYDGDELALSGSDQCIVAFATADMLQRQRQYGKAKAVQQEALTLLVQLKQQETMQMAHRSRIIPDDTWGDDATQSTKGTW